MPIFAMGKSLVNRLFSQMRAASRACGSCPPSRRRLDLFGDARRLRCRLLPCRLRAFRRPDFRGGLVRFRLCASFRVAPCLRRRTFDRHASGCRVSSRRASRPCVVRALGVPLCALRILDRPCAFGAHPPRPCLLRRLRRGSSRRRPGPRQGDGANDFAEEVLGRVTAERLRRLEEALHLLGAAHPRPGALRHSLSSRGRRRL